MSTYERIMFSPQVLEPQDSLQKRAYDNFQRIITNDYASVEPDNTGYYTNRGLGNYNLLLPQHNGLSFLQTLELKRETTAQPLEVLDIGCGQGNTLAELIRDYDIHATGIAATDLRSYAHPLLIPYAEMIDMQLGDIHDIATLLAQKKFDFIISVKTFEHLTDSQRVIKQCRELLKPDGLAFIEDRGRQSQVVPGTSQIQLHPVFSFSDPLIIPVKR